LAQLGGDTEEGSGLIVPKGKVPQVGLEYIRKYRDVKYYETIFELLARQYELAKLDEAREGALIQVVDPAVVPDRKSFPKRGLITIIAAFAGLIIGVFVALMQEGLSRLKEDPEQAQKLNALQAALRKKRTA